jgi:prevent-host-death family protein
MRTVGVRELKNRLSEYLRIVRTGESVLITDRSEVIAEIVPPGGLASDGSLPPGLIGLVRRGVLTLGSGSAGTYPALTRSKRRYSAAQLLEEERGPR